MQQISKYLNTKESIGVEANKASISLLDGASFVQRLNHGRIRLNNYPDVSSMPG